MNWRQFFTSNQWWGKLLGAFFGYLIGGPAGAFFGIIVGNIFDRGIFSHFTRPDWHYHAEKRQAVQKKFFDATFLVMGYLAKADGRVSEQEIRVAEALMNDLRLNHAQKNCAKQLFSQGKANNFNLIQTVSELKIACHDNPDLLRLFMDIQYRVAQTDGLTELKIKALDQVFQAMGFAPIRQQYRFYEDFFYQRAQQQQSSSQGGYSQQNNRSSNQNYQRYQQPPHSSLALAYALLDISSNASKQEVKTAYRRLISRNHPDKLIAQGLPEEMIKIANEKTQKIRKAYEQICASKGW